MDESPIESSKPAHCKNQPRLAIRLLPNALTALRLPLTLLVLWLLYSGLKGLPVRINPLLYFLFALICLSDFFDGKIARHLGVQSRTGAILDVSADCFFIFSSLFTLNLFGLMPIWYTLLVIADFAFFILTSRLLKQKTKWPVSFVFDSLGRAAACLFYIIPVLCCLTLSLPQTRLMSSPCSISMG